MGRKVIDLVVKRLREDGRLRKKIKSRTRDVLIGGFPERTGRRFARISRFIRRRRNRGAPTTSTSVLDAAAARHLWQSYGANWTVVSDLIATDPSLGQPVVPGVDVICAEIVFAARYEMARTLLDALARRTHTAQLDRDQARSVAPAVAALMGGELGWSEEAQREQVASYLEHVEQFSIDPLRR